MYFDSKPHGLSQISFLLRHFIFILMWTSYIISVCDQCCESMLSLFVPQTDSK